MPTAYVVYNPFAGRYPAKMMAENAANVLRGYGWQIRMEEANNGSHITELAHQASREGMDGFIITGGDGSINLALPGLIGSDTALGVLPAGTANVWAQEIGLPHLSWTNWSALEESAHRLAGSRIYSIDVGMVNQNPFLLWAGVGLDAYVVHRMEPRGRLEKYFAAIQYTASAAWSASFWRGINLKVEVEGQHISGHYLLGVVNNIHLYAGGLAELSPEALLDDGLMDLWLFEGEDLFDTVQHAVDLLTGRHLHSEQVTRFPCRQLSIESDLPLYCQMDGEPVEAEQRVEIEVRQQSLRVFLPEQTPRYLLSGEQHNGPA